MYTSAGSWDKLAKLWCYNKALMDNSNHYIVFKLSLLLSLSCVLFFTLHFMVDLAHTRAGGYFMELVRK